MSGAKREIYFNRKFYFNRPLGKLEVTRGGCGGRGGVASKKGKGRGESAKRVKGAKRGKGGFQISDLKFQSLGFEIAAVVRSFAMWIPLAG